jgi:hypothetical protein
VRLYGSKCRVLSMRMALDQFRLSKQGGVTWFGQGQAIVTRRGCLRYAASLGELSSDNVRQQPPFLKR